MPFYESCLYLSQPLFLTVVTKSNPVLNFKQACAETQSNVHWE